MGLPSSGVLANLNKPPLVAASGLAVTAVLPVLEKSIIAGSIPFNAVKVINLLAFCLNFYAARQPGRLDGIQQDEYVDIGKDKDGKKMELADMNSPRRGRSLIAPSGWAFIIWAPIFLGELVFCLATAVAVRDSSTDSAVAIRQASAGFIASQVFQTLWAASFRPKYLLEKGRIWISGGMLTGIAYALSRAHAGYTIQAASTAAAYNSAQYALLFLPLSLHFGWTTAASLVNVNGSFVTTVSSPLAIAWFGHASAVAATVLGVVITVTRQAPVFGGVIAWALAACATGMKTRVAQTEHAKAGEKMAAGRYGARVQLWLCAIGSAISLASSILVSFAGKKYK